MAPDQHIIADRTLIRVAQIISAIFTPFSIPFLAFLILFLFSYLHIMPLAYKLIVLGVVYCFTILMPTITIFVFRKVNGFSPADLTERKRRFIPFLLTILSYILCLFMITQNLKRFIQVIIIFQLLNNTATLIIVTLYYFQSNHEYSL